MIRRGGRPTPSASRTRARRRVVMQANPRELTPAPAVDALDFRPSPEVTLGVELELQILDPQTGELAPGALRLLDACHEEGLEGVDGEFLLSMIEIKTGICRNVAEAQ